MTSIGDDGQEPPTPGPSAPWERPARWADEPPALPPRRARSRRYADDGDGVSASDLIAALGGSTDSAETTDHALDTAPVDQAGVPPLPGVDAAESAAPAVYAGDDVAPDAQSPWAAPSSPLFLGETGLAADAAGSDAPADDHGDDGHDGDDSGGGHSGMPRRGWRVAGRSLVAALAVILLLVAGTEWVIKYRADRTLADNQIHALDPTDTNISQPTLTTQTIPSTETGAVAPPVPKTYQAENILILGSDNRSRPEDAALGGANSDPGGSDVVMVAHLSADRSHITVVSIPRDTYVKAPTCKAWDYENDKLSDTDFTSPYTIWRINSTYAAGGPQCTVKAVQEMTGLRIDRVIVIDFAGFAAMVDALNGIDVNACAPIVDGQLGTVLPQAGVQHIDGKQALNLVRARKVEGDTTSDIARINRQQKVLSTILKQMTSAGVLLNPVKLDSVLQAFVSNVQTDNVTIDDLLNIAQSLGNLDPRRVTFFTLPTTPDSNGVGLHATDASALIWEALRDDKPLPGEATDPVTPPSTTTAPTTLLTTIAQEPVTSTVTQVMTTTPAAPQVLSVAPGQVNLQVVNVAGRSLVANAARDALTPLGFQLASSDLLRLDGESQVGITVEYSGDHRDAALTVAAAVPGSRLVVKNGLGSKVRLMLGTSFDSAAFKSQVRKVAVGDPVPAALATEATPVVSTVTSTVVTTPPPKTVPVTPTTSAPKTTDSTPSDVEFTSVNAGSAGCI